MAFLTTYDLTSTLNSRDISTLSESQPVINSLITRAVSETKSFIQHRYDANLVFPNVNIFDIDEDYLERDIIFYSENEWLIASTYAIGDRVSYNEKIYESLQGSNTGNNPYTADTFWEEKTDNNKYYTAAQDGTGNYPEDTAYWTVGDTRDPSIIDIVSIITIFYLFRKQTPRTTPEWIVSEYDRVKDDLKAYQRGTRTIILPVRTDEEGEEEGHEIIYGSQEQKNWNY